MNPTPIVTPILLLLKSRKVIVSLCALAITLLVYAVPDLAPFREELTVVVTGLALALIGGISYEDAHKAGQAAVETEPANLEAAIKDAALALIEAAVGDKEVVSGDEMKMAVKAQAARLSQPHR